MNRGVFVDRDGVINRPIIIDGKPYPPNNISDLELLPGVIEAITRLRMANLIVVIVTNQPDVASGKQQRDVVEAMHSYLCSVLQVQHVKVCYHLDTDNCDCRKPKPGMLLEAAKEYDLDLSSSYMVGDRWRDVGAGQAAKCKCFFIDYGYKERQPEPPFITVSSLLEAATLIT